MNLDKDFWNNRYLNNDTGWDIGNVSTPIKEYFDQIEDENLKILIPGCGNSYEGEYLHKIGFKNVNLIDLSPQALDNFSKRVPNFPKEHLICNDFFQLNDSFDIIVEQTFFCAINKSLRQKYVAQCAKLLPKNGKIIGLLFDAPLNEEHPPFGGSKAEYLSLFKSFFVIETMEKAFNSISSRADRELFVKLAKK